MTPEALARDPEVAKAFRRLEEAVVYEQDGRVPCPLRDAAYPAFISTILARYRATLPTSGKVLDWESAEKSAYADCGVGHYTVARYYELLESNLQTQAQERVGVLEARIQELLDDKARENARNK